MAEENIIMCCGPKIWTRVAGYLQLAGCLVMACVGPFVADAIVEGQGQEPKEGMREATLVGLYLGITLGVILTALLLVGNEKERAGFLIPWMVLTYISIGFCVLRTIGSIASGDMGRIFASLTQIAVEILFVYAVHRRYKEIKVIRSSAQRQDPVAKF